MNIALIDDKEFGRHQIQNAVPRPDFTITWFASVAEFLEKKETFDMIFLDFYLEKDGITGDTVVEKIRPYTDILVGFSSCEKGNKKILDAGADYAFDKVWNEKNAALENFFFEIV